MLNSSEQIQHLALNNFEVFNRRLKSKSPLEWKWLMGHLEGLVIPWLFKKVQSLPVGYNTSKKDFVEEVFANTTYKFFDLFNTGTFNSLSDLQGLAFRVAELKLKEGFYAVKRDAKFSFGDELPEEALNLQNDKNPKREEALEHVKAQIHNLPFEEQQILIEYLKGYSFKEIAVITGLSEANCRKKKERALKKIKSSFFNLLQFLLILLSI